MSGKSAHFEFPPSTSQLSDADPAMFIHNRERPFHMIAEPLSVVILRLLSVALGLVMIGVVFIVAGIIFPENGLVATAAALIVAGWPQFLFMSRAISNDVLATALAVIVLVILLLPGRPYRFVWASLFSGLAILTKINMAFTAVVLLLTFITELIMQREGRYRYFGAGVLSLIVLTGLLSPLALHPIIRSHVMQTSSAFSTITDAAYTWSYWQQVFQLTLSSGWARFGWMNIPAPQWQTYTWWLFLGGTGILGLWFAWQEVSVQRRREILFILAVWSAGVLASYIQINLNRFQPQFRFVFTLLPVVATLAGAGYMQLMGPSPRKGFLALLTLGAVLFVANVWLLIKVVGHAYG